MAIVFACQTAAAAENEPTAEAVRKRFSEYFKPIPKAALVPKGDAKIVDLGRRLFFDRALSENRTRSCNDCHDLSKYGTNGPVAIEARKAGTLKRDVPSLYNIADLQLTGWSGKKSDLRTQTSEALAGSAACDMLDGQSIAKRLQSIPHYQDGFKDAFGADKGEITRDKILDALTAFQQGLVTRAPFDDFLSGDDKALTAEQLKGAMLFDQKNCSACHTGSGIGGQMVQKSGIVIPWPNQKDLGYFEVTKNPDHKLMFRVPSLRNVAETGPYFHDYSARSLSRAIREITLHQQGMILEFGEILLIESFLKSFTGKLPTEYIKPPVVDEAAPPSSGLVVP